MNSLWSLRYVLRDIALSPSSFSKPKEVKLAPVPHVGDQAPELPGLDSAPSIVVFLRHVGCPFAEVTMRQLIRCGVRNPAINLVVVTHSTQRSWRAWCATFDGPGRVRVVADRDRVYYGGWGVGLTDRRHFAGPESLAALKRLLAEGVHNRRADGNRWQGAASFAVEAHTIRWRHLPAHAGDLPPLDDAVESLSADEG